MNYALLSVKNSDFRIFPVLYASTVESQVERFVANSLSAAVNQQYFMGFIKAKIRNPKTPKAGKKIWYACTESEYKYIQANYGFQEGDAVGLIYSHAETLFEEFAAAKTEELQ